VRSKGATRKRRPLYSRLAIYGVDRGVVIDQRCAWAGGTSSDPFADKRPSIVEVIGRRVVVGSALWWSDRAAQDYIAMQRKKPIKIFDTKFIVRALGLG
jgi:hypothetical protein